MTRSCWRCSINPASGPCPRASDASPAARRRSRVAACRVARARDHRLDDPNSVGTGVGGGRGRGADGIGRPRGTRGGGRGVRRRDLPGTRGAGRRGRDRKSTRLNSSHLVISYAVFCLKKKNNNRYAGILILILLINQHLIMCIYLFILIHACSLRPNPSNLCLTLIYHLSDLFMTSQLH